MLGRCRDERGLTVVELTITLAVMAVIVSAAFSVLFSVYKNTGVVLNRRDVVGAGQIAMQEMTKQFRQATAINASSATKLDVNTFSGAGNAKQIVWRTTGSSAPYSLQTCTGTVGGGTCSTDGAFKTVLTYLTSPNLFTFPSSDPTNPCKIPVTDSSVHGVCISLSLGTKTSAVVLASDVEMRNL